MTVSKHVLPTGDGVTVYHVTNKDGAAGTYFNGKRMGIRAPSTAELYKIWLPKYQTMLVRQLEESGMEFDAVVSPPSSGNDAQPYREAILQRWPVLDLSPAFSRKNVIKASRAETTVDDLVDNEFVHVPTGDESQIKSILIVDEAFATGKSVAAIIELLRRAGMPADAKVAVAVCSKMSS